MKTIVLTDVEDYVIRILANEQVVLKSSMLKKLLKI